MYGLLMCPRTTPGQREPHLAILSGLSNILPLKERSHIEPLIHALDKDRMSLKDMDHLSQRVISYAQRYVPRDLPKAAA
jgi:hypothetical protein